MSNLSDDLAFEILCPDDDWPVIDYPSGQELSVFLPDGRSAVQLNHGQGEGQALIDGVEWGFYYNNRGNLDVVLHGTGMSPSQAADVVLEICRTLARRHGVAFAYRLASHANILGSA